MEGGVATVCFATGMAAIGAMFLSLLRGGDHIVASSFVFGNTNSLLATLADHGTPVTFVDATNVDNVERALTPATRVVFVETIANPRTQVADLARIGELCRDRGLLYVVDNTMTSPWLFRPSTVHAGLIVNALTKYIGGHGNALGGAVTDTGQFDWTRFANIADSYKRPEAGAVGHHADAQERPARLGRHAGRRAGAPPRRRRRDAGAADGRGNARTRRRSRSFCSAIRR